MPQPHDEPCLRRAFRRGQIDIATMVRRYGAIIMPNVTIGPDAIVAAGAVDSDVPQGAMSDPRRV